MADFFEMLTAILDTKLGLQIIKENYSVFRNMNPFLFYTIGVFIYLLIVIVVVYIVTRLI